MSLQQEGTVISVQITSQKTRTDIWGKFLTFRGEYPEMYCIVRNNCVLIRYFNRKCQMLYSCGFRSSCTIVDICYLPFKANMSANILDGSNGVVIAVNDTENDEYFLGYYSMQKSKFIKKIAIRQKITKIAAILDSTRKKEIGSLHENLNNSPQLVAVGTYGGNCYLVHFGIDLPNVIDAEIRSPPFCSNISKSHIVNGRFQFQASSGATVSKDCKDVQVTAISYLERCKTVVVGLSCGLFLVVNLVTGNDTSYYYSSSPVYNFACQEPVDDPRPVLYLWVAYSAGNQRGPHVVLCVVNFPSDEGHPSTEWLLNDLLIINYLTWFPENCRDWLSFRTVILSASNSVPNASAQSNSRNSSLERLSSSDETFPRANGIDTSRVLMTWITTGNDVKGALFDLNAFYYKRLPRMVAFDQSVLMQNPFLSVFSLPVISEHQMYLDCLVNCLGIRQYQSPHSETDDVFIFASSYSFEIIAFSGSREYIIAVPSMQKVVLSWIDGNFEDALGKKSELACLYLSLVGLAKTTDTSEHSSPIPLENASVVVSSLLFNGDSYNTLKRQISICPSYDTIHQLATLIWKEVVNAKQKFDELSELWFDGIPRVLSAANKSWLRGSAAVFHRAAELFAEISKRVPSDKVAEATSIKYNMMASRNLVFYTNTVFLFRQLKLLPCENYTALAARIKAKLDTRKKLCAGKKLYIISLLEEMQNACPNETFWCGLTAENWYPPNSIWYLLSVTLTIKITDSSKHKLIGYFLLDYDDVMEKEVKVFERFKWRFTCEDQIICSQIEMHWKNDCGLEIQGARKERVTVTTDTMTGVVTEVDQLMKRLLLNNKQIKFIKETLLKKTNGVRRWNQFCLERKMFSRLLPPEQAGDGLLTDRCDRWAAKIIKYFPSFPKNVPLPTTVHSSTEFSASSGKLLDEVLFRQNSTTNKYSSPILRSHGKPEPLIGTKQQPYEISKVNYSERISKIAQLESPVYDKRISNYERMLPKEELEKVQCLLRTPTPQRHSGLAVQALNPYLSPTAYQFGSISLPTSILKTGRKQLEENLSIDVSEQHSKNLRFDLPNPNVSESESTVSNISQKEEEGYDEVCSENVHADASNILELDLRNSLHPNEESVMEKSFEQQEDPEDLFDMSQQNSYPVDAQLTKSSYKISFEEQNISDVMENHEKSSFNVHEMVVERYFEEQEETEDLVKVNDMCSNEIKYPPVPEVCSIVQTSYEEQEDPESSFAEPHGCNFSYFQNEKEQRKDHESEGLFEDDEVIAPGGVTTEQISESPVFPDLSKKDSNFCTVENTCGTVTELGMITVKSKKLLFEQEDESDPTSSEIDTAVSTFHESEKVKGSKEPEKMEAIKECSPRSKRRKFPSRRYSFGSSSSVQRRRKQKHTIRAPPISEAAEHFDLSNIGVRRRNRAISTQSSHSGRKSRKTGKSADEHIEFSMNPLWNQEVTRECSTRTTSSSKDVGKDATPRRKRKNPKSTDTVHLLLDTVRDERAFSSRSSDSVHSFNSGSEISTSSYGIITRSAARAAKLASLSPEAKIVARRRLLSEASSEQSREATPKCSIRRSSLSRSASSKKLRITRTLSEQVKANHTINEASSARCKRAFSEDIQTPEMKTRGSARGRRLHKEEKGELKIRKVARPPSNDSFQSSDGEASSTSSHPMLTRSASRGKSRSKSPSKHQAYAKFEPDLARIDEVPKKRSRLRAGRKTVAQILEEKKIE